MKKQKGKSIIKLFIFILFFSIFLVQSSDNSFAWGKYQKDSWSSGVQLDFYGDFSSGWNETATGVHGTNKSYGLLMMELHTPEGYVNESAIFVWGGGNTIYAYGWQQTTTLNQLDSYYSGYLKGDWYGSDYDDDGEVWDIFGIFSYEEESEEMFFRHFGWNRTLNEFFLIWNYSLGNFTDSSSIFGFGTSCANYDSSFMCISYTDQENLSGSGYGDFWEFDIYNQTVKHYEFNWTNEGGGYKHPLIHDFDEDDDTEFLFFGDSTGTQYYLFSFDLTNWRLDGGDSAWCEVHNCFTNDGKSDVTVGEYLDVVAPMLIETGTYCDRNFWDCITPPWTCYDCVPDAREIVVSYNKGTGAFEDYVSLFDSEGTKRFTTWTGYQSRTTCGNTQVDCNGDDILDIVIGSTSDTGTWTYLQCIDGQTGDRLGGVNGINLESLAGNCSIGSGLLLAEMDGNTSTHEIVYVNRVISVSNWSASTVAWEIDWAGDYDFVSFIMGDLNHDTQIDFIGSSDTDGTVVISGPFFNRNPYFIGDGPDVDTCVPLCVNETITFYARQGLDYDDWENDWAYLGVDCYEIGLSNLTWGSRAEDPDVTCTYDSLGSWEVDVYITDYANKPIHDSWIDEKVTIGIYTSLSSNCYSAGEWEEECSPFVFDPPEPVERCFTDSAISVCLVKGTSVFLCNFCDCDDLPMTLCPAYYDNGTMIDGYDEKLFSWSECESWEGSVWYGACPFYIWIISALEGIWNFIFGAFWIFLTLLLVIVVVAIVIKKRGVGK